MKLAEYTKAGIALLAAVLAALITALGTGDTDFADLDTQTWLVALGAVLASGALVAFVDNVPGAAGGIIKAVIGAFGAAVASLITALDDDVLTRVEQLTALSAFVVALAAVYQFADAEPEPAPPAPEPVGATVGYKKK
jgi:hypothetical protein